MAGSSKQLFCPTTELVDDAHRAAFRGGRLGRPIIVPSSRVGAVTQDDVLAFRNKYYHGSNITVVGTGESDHRRQAMLC